MNELELADHKILEMVMDIARNGSASLRGLPLKVLKSDSYGDHKHRTWVFYSGAGEAVGSIERYWGGLKMICSVFGGSPRTSFFTEEGQRTTNKGLKGSRNEV